MTFYIYEMAIVSSAMIAKGLHGLLCAMFSLVSLLLIQDVPSLRKIPE